MSLLLAPDDYDIVRGGQPDAHGWGTAAPGQVVGSERGSIQPSNRTASVDATGRGQWDAGPNAPAPVPTARGFLPPGTDARPGDVLVTTYGERWRVLSLVRVGDPTGGALACTEALLEADHA